jgi:hypothetical protein
VNADLISGLNNPAGIAVVGSGLFVANFGDGTVGEYTTSGAAVNADLISRLSEPWGIVVVPEPATGSILLMAGMGLLMRRRRKPLA